MNLTVDLENGLPLHSFSKLFPFPSLLDNDISLTHKNWFKILSIFTTVSLNSILLMFSHVFNEIWTANIIKLHLTSPFKFYIVSHSSRTPKLLSSQSEKVSSLSCPFNALVCNSLTNSHSHAFRRKQTGREGRKRKKKKDFGSPLSYNY